MYLPQKSPRWRRKLLVLLLPVWWSRSSPLPPSLQISGHSQIPTVFYCQYQGLLSFVKEGNFILGAEGRYKASKTAVKVDGFFSQNEKKKAVWGRRVGGPAVTLVGPLADVSSTSTNGRRRSKEKQKD